MGEVEGEARGALFENRELEFGVEGSLELGELDDDDDDTDAERRRKAPGLILIGADRFNSVLFEF